MGNPLIQGGDEVSRKYQKGRGVGKKVGTFGFFIMSSIKITHNEHSV